MLAAWKALLAASKITRREVTIAGLAAAVVLVAGLFVAHVRDRRREAELTTLRSLVARDSVTRVAAVARTDSAAARADTAVRATRSADSDWAHARAAAARVPAILTAPVHDTLKIKELVATVDTLRIAGDSLDRAAAADTAAIAQLRVAQASERNAWTSERNDLRHALAVSEAQHRHWGLGATLGYGVQRDPSGVIRAGPALVVGLTYRW